MVESKSLIAESYKHLTEEEKQMVKEHGMVVPSCFLGANGPKVMKRNPAAHDQCCSDFPYVEEQEIK